MRQVALTLADIGMINGTRFVIRKRRWTAARRHNDCRTPKAANISLLIAGILLSIPMGQSFLSKLRTVHARSQHISEKRAA